MSGQENTPASTGQAPLVSTKGSNVPFAPLADNREKFPDSSSIRQKASGCPAPSQTHNAQSRPLQLSLPDAGSCVYMLADWTSAEYRVRRSPNGVYDLIMQVRAPGGPPQCKFTLIPKGDYIGIRCADAKGRYLQGRKRGLLRFVFYSDHCGIWEQWKVLKWGQEGIQGERLVEFASRRLPKLTWKARMIPADAAPSSRPNSAFDQTDAEDAPAEAGVLDLSRRLTTGFVHRLHLGPLPAVFATWRQLAVQAKQRMGQLRKCEQRWHRRWLQEGFARWRTSAAAQRRRRCLLQRASSRHATRLMQAAMSAWLEYTACQHALHRAEATLRGAHMRHVLGSAFDAWMQRVEGKRHLAAMCARITAWHAHRKLRTLFAAWAGLTQQEHFARLHDEGLLEATEANHRESEDAPNATLTFPLQSRQHKCLSRLAMLKQQQPSDMRSSATQQQLRPARIKESSALQDASGDMLDKWHAAIETQPIEASPAIELSGYWTEARPGMPSVVTRSQLRAPVWHPPGGPMSGQLQHSTPAAPSSGLQRATSPYLNDKCSSKRCPELKGPGASAASASPSPLTMRQHHSSASDVAHTCSSAGYEREETPFFTPLAALPAVVSTAALSARPSRPMASLDPDDTGLQNGRQNLLSDVQVQSQSKSSREHSQPREEPQKQIEGASLQYTDSGHESDQQVESPLEASQRRRCSEDAERRGGSDLSHTLQESLVAGQDDGRQRHKNAECSDRPCKAICDDADAVHTHHNSSSSSSSSSWDTEMAAKGSSRVHFLSSEKGSATAHGKSELQATPSSSRRPEQEAASTHSSMGECVTPDMVGHQLSPPVNRGVPACELPYPEQGHALGACATGAAHYSIALHDPAQKLSSMGKQGKDSHAAFAYLSDGQSISSSMQKKCLMQHTPSLCPAEAVQSPTAPPESTWQMSSVGSQGSSGHVDLSDISNRQRSSSGRQSAVLPHLTSSEPSVGAACSPLAQPGSAQQRSSVGLQGSSGTVDSLDVRSDQKSISSSLRCVRAGGRVWDSSFWEVPAGALPGQATQSPLSSRPGPEAASARAPALCPSSQLMGPRVVSGAEAVRPATYRSAAHDIAAGRSTCFAEWAAAERTPAEDSFSPLNTLGLALSPAPVPQEQQTSGQQSRYQSVAHDVARRSSCSAARAGADITTATDSHAQLSTSPPALSLASRKRARQTLQQQSTVCSVANEIAAKSSTCFAAWPAGGSALAKESPSPVSTPEPRLLNASHQADQQTAEQSLRWDFPDRADWGTLDVPPTKLLAVLHGRSQPVASAAREDAFLSDSLTAEAISATLHEQSHPVSVVPFSPSLQSQGRAHGRRGSYDSLQAARQVFGESLGCHSPALAMRGWDGSLMMAFTAWQHVTVMLWQRRLQTAAPLLHRRRFRLLAWPFRAWAARLDCRRQAASSNAAIAGSSPSAALVCLQRQREECSTLHKSFWHWQEATVWGWKQRRDALATAKASRLSRMIHAWRSLAAAADDDAVCAFRAAAASARLVWAFRAWLAAAHEQAAAVAAFQKVCQANDLTAVLRAWQEIAQIKVFHRAIAHQLLQQQIAAALQAVLKHWRAVTVRSQEVAALAERLERGRTKQALCAWQQAAQHSRQLQAASLCMREAAAKVRAARAFEAWCTVWSLSRALTALQHHHVVRLGKHALHIWQAYAAHSLHTRSAAAIVAARTAATLTQHVFQALQEHAISCRNARALAESHAAACSQRMLGRCLASWQSQARSSQRHAVLAEQLCAENLLRSFLGAWQTWREAVRSAAAQAEAAEHSAGQRQMRLLRAIVHGWRQQTELAEHLTERAEEQGAMKLLRSFLDAWQGWRNAVRAAAAQAQAAEHFALQRQVQLLKPVVHAWQEETEQAQLRTAAALLQCLDAKAWRTQHQVMTTWRLLVQHAKAARAWGEASFRAREADLQSNAFLSWREAARTAAEARAVAGMAIRLSSMQCTGRAMLTAWHDEASRAGSARQRAGAMAQKRLSFACWREETELMNTAWQAAIEALTERRSALTLQQCLFAWRAYHIQLQSVRAAAESYGQGRESALLHSIMTEWRQVSSAERVMRESNVQSFQLASQRRLVSSVLSQWQELQSTLQAARTTAEEAHAVLQAGTLRDAFLTWRSISASMADSQQLSSQSVSRAFSARKLRFILRAWVDICRTYQAARQAAQDLADRAQLHSMQRAFSAWRIANASLQHQRSSLLNLCIQLALEGRLSATFTSWRVIARSRRQAVLEARRLEAQHRRRMLRQAFVAWRIANAALAHQQRRVAELMLAARAQRGQRAAFLAWRQHMAHMWTARNTAALKGLARQKQMQAALLTWALRSWRQYTRERAGRKLEEASLTRTIILTRAFHSWAALALWSKLQVPAECSDTKTRCVALEESIDALELQRAARWEELRSSANVLDQSRHLQDELEELQEHLHTMNMTAWRRMLPASTAQQTT